MQLNLTWQRRAICFFLSFVAIAGILSCKKEKGNGPDADTKTQLVKIDGGEYMLQLQYNAQGKPASITTNILAEDDIPERFQVSYGEQGRILELAGETGFRITPVYDGGTLIRAHLHQGAEHFGYANYNIEDGKVSEITLYLKLDEAMEPVLSYRFTYDAEGNAAEAVLLVQGNVPNQLVRAGHVTYQYDTRKNPLYEHADLMLLMMQVMPKNNPLLEEYFGSNMTLEDRHRYTYTYKTNNLPQKALVRIGLNDANAQQQELKYTYQ